MLRLFLLAAAYISFSHSAIAGPFGLDVESFNPVAGKCELKQPNLYSCNVPKPHPDIESYIVKFVENVGICLIKGISEDIPDSRYGIDTKSKTDEIAAQLTPKYGKNTEFIDNLLPGSIWDQPEDWMMGLIKEERFYMYVWKPNEPVDGIISIYLAAQNTNTDNGYFAVEFHTSKSAECEAAIEKGSADSF